jgi:outer membrane protein OmpA-like peptidoglycan-associated protein
MRIIYMVPLAVAFAWPFAAHAATATAAAPPPPAVDGTCGLARVHFELDSAELSTADQALLGDMANCLKQNKRLRVSLEGRADARGPEAYNLQLGESRAEAVYQYLRNQGVSPEQLRTVSFGDLKPLCKAQDEQCWSRNRSTAVRPTCRM